MRRVVVGGLVLVAAVAAAAPVGAERVDAAMLQALRQARQACLDGPDPGRQVGCLDGVLGRALGLADRLVTVAPPVLVQGAAAGPAADDLAAFVQEAKAALTRDFKDPQDVRWRGVFVSEAGVRYLCGEVNARNGYGGFVGFQRFYVSVAPPRERVGLEGRMSAVDFSRYHGHYCGGRVLDVAD